MNRWKSVSIFHLRNLSGPQINECQTCIRNAWGEFWVPARPIGYISWGQKLKALRLVWQGKADVVIWPEDEPDYGMPK